MVTNQTKASPRCCKDWLHSNSPQSRNSIGLGFSLAYNWVFLVLLFYCCVFVCLGGGGGVFWELQFMPLFTNIKTSFRNSSSNKMNTLPD